MLRNVILAAIAATALSSCSLINDSSDCVQSVSVFSFHYDRNLKNVCASASEVKSVTLLMFDAETGVLAHADRLVRTAPGGEPEITVRTEPGEYDVLVWAGNYDSHYNVPSPTVGSSKLADFTCALAAPADEELEPLFHSLRRVSLGYAAESRPDSIDMTLTKNTNRVRVMLQHLSGEPVDAGDFIFEISDNNSLLDFDNSRHSASAGVVYKPHHLFDGSTDINTGTNGTIVGSRAATVASVALAEFTVNRLLADSDARLVVRRPGMAEPVISIPLVRYALMVQGHEYRDMDPQEYLDRQDEYNLTFFLDSQKQWINTTIIVNDWWIQFKESDLN